MTHLIVLWVSEYFTRDGLSVALMRFSGVLTYHENYRYGDFEDPFPESFHWMFERGRPSAIQTGAPDLQMLGRLIILDYMIYYTVQWIKILETLLDRYGKNMENHKDDEGLPIVINHTAAANLVAEKADSVLQSLGLSPSSLSDPARPHLIEIAGDLRYQVRHIQHLATQIQALCSTNFNDQISRANIRESRAVRRLSILASLFLPLSLSATILSMQSRFVGIHLILWDYITICIDLGLIVFITFRISKSTSFTRQLVDYIKGMITDVGEDLGEDSRQRQWTITWLSLPLPLALIVIVALNFGMFGNIHIAWKILGYGAAVGGGILVLGAMWYLIAGCISADRLASESIRKREAERSA